ncbi:MAG: hypothetical protein AAF346_06270 [Pseudomonadota bacterium]
MAQELVKFSGATGIVERPEYSLALSGLTPNQERLRELLNGEAAPEDSRFYHPPDLQTEALDWHTEVGGPIACVEDFDTGFDMARSDDPKACWTGFAFGIACAAVIGGASFLSIAAVVTPQPSIAALVPFELEQRDSKVGQGRQVAVRSAAIPGRSHNGQLERAPAKISTSKIWQELRRFHASAGKFSQPRILLVSSPTPKNMLDGGELHERKAALSKPQLERVVSVEQPAASQPNASKVATDLKPRIINAVSEPIVLEHREASATKAPIIVPVIEIAQGREPEAARVVEDKTKGLTVLEDTMVGATSTAKGSSSDSLPSEPVESGLIKTAEQQIKVIKSSLKPTARTKVRLPDGRRYSIVGSKARKTALRATKLAKKKRVADQNIFFKIQVRPDWAELALSQSNQ